MDELARIHQLRGVIVEETVEQLFLKRNDAGSWIEDSASSLSLSKEVPWYLDDGTGQVFVVGARDASGMALTVASEVFEESRRSLVRGTFDYLQGLKMLGVKRTEMVLPICTVLTVVGEAVKEDIGTIRIQRPYDGPFYVSTKTIDELIWNLGKRERWYKYASLGLAVYGVYLLVDHAIQYIMERKHRRDLQRRILAAAAAAQRQGQNDDVGSIGNSDGERRLSDPCIICLEEAYNAVFIPCGHMCCCTSCSSRLTSCPLCRSRVDQVVRTFHP